MIEVLLLQLTLVAATGPTYGWWWEDSVKVEANPNDHQLWMTNEAAIASDPHFILVGYTESYEDVNRVKVREAVNVAEPQTWVGRELYDEASPQPSQAPVVCYTGYPATPGYRQATWSVYAGESPQQVLHIRGGASNIGGVTGTQYITPSAVVAAEDWLRAAAERARHCA